VQIPGVVKRIAVFGSVICLLELCDSIDPEFYFSINTTHR
ncbi:unnamed protein product, partial [Acidithrix sp. C25]